MTYVPIIGITGRKGSGKTTFASNIRDRMSVHHDMYGARYFFAQPLKEVCHKLFGGTVDNWYGDYKNVRMEYWAERLGEKYSSARRIMQSVGTELFRDHVAKDFWLFTAQTYINAIVENESPDFIIIDDVRFDNEAEFILSANTSNVIIQTHRSGEGAGDEHRSEKGINPHHVFKAYHVDDTVSVDSTIQCVNDILAHWRHTGIIR